MNAPEDILIDRLLTVFGEPKVDAPDAYLVEFGNALRGWDANILAKAGDEVIRSCKFWPRPAEVIDIARGIAASEAAARQRNAPPPHGDDRPPLSPEAAARAQELVAEMKRFIAANTINDPATKPIDWVRGQKPGFERMQRESPNHGLHRVLTQRSRAMSGEHDE